MSADPVSRPWRRNLRFSVRGLIVLVLVTGAALGLMVRTDRNARIERAALAAIKDAGGSVSYDSVGHIRVWFYMRSTRTDAALVPVARPTRLHWLSGKFG